MTEPERRPWPWVAAAKSWQNFWFRASPAYTLGLVRMAFGAVAIGWTVSLLPDLYELFGPHGVEPRQPGEGFQWGVFAIWTTDRALLVGWTVLLVSAVALTIGWHSRSAALVVFVLIVSFEHRNPWVWNSGDIVIRLEALFLALSPCGAALSLDQKRTAGMFWSAQQRPQWPVRLMQLQLSLIYLASVLSKITGSAWPQGTAVSYALRLQDMLLAPVPDWLTDSALLMNIATWGSLGVELSLAILVWNSRLRPWVLAAGVVMHTLIMITIAVGFFTLAMFVLYLAFIPPEIVQRLPHNTKHIAMKTATMLTRWPRSGMQSRNAEKATQPGVAAKGSSDDLTRPSKHVNRQRFSDQ
jgi:hypothetical protein